MSRTGWTHVVVRLGVAWKEGRLPALVNLNWLLCAEKAGEKMVLETETVEPDPRSN